MSVKPRGKNHFKAKWLEIQDGNGDLIGSYLRRVDDFSCECTRCSKVIAVANLGLSAIHRHVKTIGHVSRTQGHVKLHAEEVDDQLITENKTEGQAMKLSGNDKNVLLDKIIERLDDFVNLVSCVEEQLHQYQRLHFVLSVLEENNATRQEHSNVKEDLEKLETIVKDEGSSFSNDDINEEDCDTQMQTLNTKNRNVRRGKNHFNDKWLEDIDTNGNNLKTYMEQHDEFSVWCYLCERAIAIDNQGQTAIMRHVKSQKHIVRLMKGQDTEQVTEERFNSIVKEETFDICSPEHSDNPGAHKEENLLPADSKVKVPKKRGINRVKDSWFERMDSNGDLVSLYLRPEGEHHVQCRWCARSINTTNIGYVAIRRHFQSRSHRAVANMIPEKTAFSDGDLDIRNTEFVCDSCGDCLRGLLKFRKHLRKHLADKQVKDVKEYSCPFCNTKFVVNYRTFLKHKRLCEVQHAVGEDFMCSVCGKSFPTHHLMYKHHYKCSGKGSRKPRLRKPCPYEGCEYSSYLSRDRENHVNRVHLNKPLSRDFECHLCGNTYNRKHQLDQHVRGEHMNEKPHKCQTCDKAFVRRDKLVQHEATHTGEMRHKCPHCAKPFINHGTMWSHKKMCSFNLNKV